MRLAAFLFCVALSTVRAQDGASAVTCRFLAFDRSSDGTASLFAAGPGEQPVDCPLGTGSLSQPVKLVAPDGKIAFRKKATDPTPAAVATVPAGLMTAIILFIPRSGGDGYGTVVIEDSAKGFPADGCVVLNLYQSDVRFVIGEHKVLLPSGKTAALARPVQRDAFNMSAIAFQFQQGKDWRTAAESMIRFAEGQRHLFVTYVDAKAKRPRLKSIRVDP
jgi:hypothetical protein